MPLPALSRRTRLGAAVVTALVAGTAVFGIGQATAEHSVPRTDKEIPNLTLVQDQIKAYYGDKVTADGEHYASPDSNYGRQVRDIEAKARTYLTKALAKYRAQSAAHRPGRGHGKPAKPAKPAIVLDMDDTTLLTYNYELQVGFHFTEASQDKYLATKDMDAVFGMDRLVNWAHDKGAEVFFLTGRKEAQRAWSVRNLKNVGYDVPLDRTHVYLKDKEHPPAYLPCGATCSTIGFKSGTRKHIESLGYDIVANFGDQYSDLQGGAGDRTFKMPNPMYYLP
ncbi:HAD family acid phosphatase [Streptomyces sp. x-80]|uniref:HAD family acid phosphatase n=1 Tax=Streptomyces sp. x-80 TaxID=2789282 RepID=UPI00398061C3